MEPAIGKLRPAHANARGSDESYIAIKPGPIFSCLHVAQKPCCKPTSRRIRSPMAHHELASSCAKASHLKICSAWQPRIHDFCNMPGQACRRTPRQGTAWTATSTQKVEGPFLPRTYLYKIGPELDVICNDLTGGLCVKRSLPNCRIQSSRKETSPQRKHSTTSQLPKLHHI